MEYYYIPLIVGLGGIIWYIVSNKGGNEGPKKSVVSQQTTTTTTTTTTGQPSSPRKLSTPTINRKKKAVPKKEKADDGKLLVKIFFGSQTGTAEDFSHKLESEGKRYGFATEVIDCEDYDFDDLQNETFAIFVMATYGEGEPTDNARGFDEWMNREHKPDELKGLKFTVFGLGNKTYEQFNAMGRKVDKKLEEFGAQRVFQKGEGDDDGSLEDDFSVWKRELWPSLCEHFNMPIPEIEENLNERRFRVDILDPASSEAQEAISSNIHLAKRNAKEGNNYDLKNPYLAKLLVNKELHTTESDRSCRHIEFEIGDELPYEVGDHLGVYPENDTQLVEQVANRLQANLNAVFAMYPINKSDKPVLGPCTVRQALSQWVDITGQPRKTVLKVLARYATNEDEKKKLLQLADENNNDLYHSYIKDDQRTILCVLNDFPSVQIPFDHFLEITPRLNARMYSISSSIKEHPGRVHITAVVVNFTSKAKRFHAGVCTNWLKRQIPSDDKPIYVPVFVEKANFRLPDNPAVPVVMIGPGTGLAPFRGFIQERKHVIKQSAVSSEAILFFGCRSRNIDYIYQEELDFHKTSGHLTELIVAFSREGTQKVYVQHKMKEYTKA